MTDEQRSQTGWIGVQESSYFLPGSLAPGNKKLPGVQALECQPAGQRAACWLDSSITHPSLAWLFGVVTPLLHN